jgi:uncharacterized membrane protein (TIGR02234 family)
MTHERREIVVATVLTVVGAVLVLVAAGRTWATATVSVLGVAAPPAHLSGRSLEPLAAALGLVALAGAVAILATRGVGRLVVGVVVALAGAGALASALSVSASAVRTSGALHDKVPTATLRAAIVTVDLTGWRHVCALGGLCLVAAGLLVAVRGRQWGTMGRKYDAPVTSGPVERELTASAQPNDESADLWERIDRGEDPTAS